MKISKIFYLFNFLLIANLLIPCFCNNLEGPNDLSYQEEIKKIEEIKAELNGKRRRKKKIIIATALTLISLMLVINCVSRFINEKKTKDIISMAIIEEAAVKRVEEDIKKAYSSGIKDIHVAEPHLGTVERYIMDVASKEGYTIKSGSDGLLRSMAGRVIRRARNNFLECRRCYGAYFGQDPYQSD